MVSTLTHTTRPGITRATRIALCTLVAAALSLFVANQAQASRDAVTYHDVVLLSDTLNSLANPTGATLGATPNATPDTPKAGAIPDTQRSLEKPTKRSADNKDTFELRLSSMGYDFSLQLSRNPAFDQTQILRDSDGTIVSREDIALPDLWSGVETTDPQSWVRLTHDNGRLSGEIHAFGRAFAIESAEHLELENTSRNVMFDASLKTLAQGRPLTPTRSNALPGAEQPVDFLVHAPPQTSPSLVAELTRNTERRVTRAIRIGVVVDSLFDEFHGQRGFARALTVMNTVDGIYQDQLGLAVMVDRIVVLDDPTTDPMRNKSGDIEDILIAFREVRQSLTSLRTDLTLVHLLTGLSDPNNVIGLGWINTACRLDGYDVSLSTPFAFDALLAAHEMAHNLGALHDNDPSCESDKTTIMWPLLSGTTTPIFSSCSIDAIAPTLAASCNIDVVDMSVEVATSVTSGLQNLFITVNNEDSVNQADRVITQTILPTGTRLIRSNGLCALAEDRITLTCNHGSMPAEDTNTVTLLVDVTSLDANRTVTTQLDAMTYADININNNRASTTFVDVQSSAALLNTASSVPSGQAGDAPNDSLLLSDVLTPLAPKTGGSGTIAPLTLGVGLILWGLAGYRRKMAVAG